MVRAVRGVAVLSILAALAACDRGQPGDDLDRLHDEAVAANRAALVANRLDRADSDSLQIRGRIKRPETIAWDELQALATTHVPTIDPQATGRTTPIDYRGVLVRDLLDRAGARDATEVTFVSRDAFRATIDMSDARGSRILLAIEADGAKITPDHGGPIYLVFPWSESSPAYRARYGDRFWAFYVTAMVVGTEEPALQVGARALDRAALDALPAATLDARPGWKVDWPSTTTHLRGVRLADVLAAAGVALPAGGNIVVRGKAPLHRDRRKPSGIAVADLARCPPLLALAHGPDDTPIPARLGGPIAMAMPPCDERYDGDPDHHWVTMVESIEVVAP
jgi:DMSO/TMAO reductase YedYZ molybdopterin-dependent catalytic subunit